MKAQNLYDLHNAQNHVSIGDKQSSDGFEASRLKKLIIFYEAKDDDDVFDFGRPNLKTCY